MYNSQWLWAPRTWGNDSVIAENSFSETRKIYNCPNEERDEGERPRARFRWPRIAAASVHQWATEAEKFVEVCYMLKSSLGIRCCVPYRRPSLPAISEMVLCCSFIILQPLVTFFYEHHLEGQRERSQRSTELATQMFVLPMALSRWGCLRTGCWGEYLGLRGMR